VWYHEKEDWVEFSVIARPGSSRSAFAGLYDGALKIHVAAPAVEGAANKALVKFLAKTFKVPKSEVTILSGEQSKRKRIRLPLNERVSAFIEEMEK